MEQQPGVPNTTAGKCLIGAGDTGQYITWLTTSSILGRLVSSVGLAEAFCCAMDAIY